MSSNITPAAGHRLLLRSLDVSDIARDICLHHHERMDGCGYPDGLEGNQGSIYARMAASCDVNDAVTSQRPYKEPWTPADALSKMISWRGQFYSCLFDAFIASIGIFPVDQLVRLSSGKLGFVLESGETKRATTKFRVFYDIVKARIICPHDVPTHSGAGGDPIVRVEQGLVWFREE